MNEVTVKTIPGEWTSVNGRVVRRVVVAVNGEQRLVERVTLDSQESIAKAAKQWSASYDVSADEVTEQLRELGISALAEEIDRRKAKEEHASKPRKRVSDLAESFLRSLRPAWHRKGKTIYLERVSREVLISQIWTVATDVQVDAVAETHEAFESGDPDYRKRLGLLREAIAMAAARLLRDLPEVNAAAEDRTVDRGDLIDKLAGVLLKSRTYRKDVGQLVTLTWHSWAAGIEPGAGWQRCFVDPVFGQIEVAGQQPIIAISGALLTSELGYQSTRKLASDLRSLELAKTEARVRCDTCDTCDAKQWRAWKLSSLVLDSIAETISDVTAPIAASQGHPVASQEARYASH